MKRLFLTSALCAIVCVSQLNLIADSGNDIIGPTLLGAAIGGAAGGRKGAAAGAGIGFGTSLMMRSARKQNQRRSNRQARDEHDNLMAQRRELEDELDDAEMKLKDTKDIQQRNSIEREIRQLKRDIRDINHKLKRLP